MKCVRWWNCHSRSMQSSKCTEPCCELEINTDKNSQECKWRILAKTVWELQELLQQQQTRKSPWKTVSRKSLCIYSSMQESKKLCPMIRVFHQRIRAGHLRFRLCSNMRAIITMRKRKTNLIPPPKRRYTLTRGLLWLQVVKVSWTHRLMII